MRIHGTAFNARKVDITFTVRCFLYFHVEMLTRLLIALPRHPCTF